MALIDKLTAIADAIRGKTGKTDGLTLDAMPGEIEGISTGDDSMDKLISGDLAHVVSNATSVRFRAFSDYTGLVSVDLPMATQCDKFAFNACTNLSDVQIPLLSSIPSYAFYNCNALTKLDLFSTNYIDGLAFCNTGLNTLILRINIAVALGAANAFDGTTFITVYVPEALIESYQTATNWSTMYANGRCNFVAIEGSEYE